MNAPAPISTMRASPDYPDPDFVVIDVETACERVSSICQVGIVGYRDGHEVFAYETLVDPRDTFSAFNIGIHGITARDVAGAPDFAQVHARLEAHLAGRVVVAHSSFDKGALAAACTRTGCAPITARWLDSVRVAKRAWPDLTSHRLNVLADFLGLAHRHHDALSDARAAGQVILRAIEHTGTPLEAWLATPPKARARAPEPAPDGPLAGMRVALLGEAVDGPLAQWVAQAGGRIVAGVGRTTTMLLVATKHPYGRFVEASPAYRKAEELRRAGRDIAILTEAVLRKRTGAF
jgi:DNA polymerase-3 subunit epsilon